MPYFRLAVAVMASIALCSCGGATSGPTAPSSAAPRGGANGSLPSTVTPPASGAGTTIGFDAVGTNGAPFATFTTSGFTVTATTSNWTISTSYGRPAPFIQFLSAAGISTIAEVRVTAAGAGFTFQSVDLYSSTTPIPYVVTGIANAATVFTIQNTQGNTFGNFARVVNPNATAQIDALLIRLSNAAAPCCANPMGLDNIVVR